MYFIYWKTNENGLSTISVTTYKIHPKPLYQYLSFLSEQIRTPPETVRHRHNIHSWQAPKTPKNTTTTTAERFSVWRFLTLRQTGKRTKEKRMTLPSPSFKEFFQKRVRILHIICVSTNYGELSSITSFTRASPFLHSKRHCAQPNEL